MEISSTLLIKDSLIVVNNTKTSQNQLISRLMSQENHLVNLLFSTMPQEQPVLNQKLIQFALLSTEPVSTTLSRKLLAKNVNVMKVSFHLFLFSTKLILIMLLKLPTDSTSWNAKQETKSSRMGMPENFSISWRKDVLKNSFLMENFVSLMELEIISVKKLSSKRPIRASTVSQK